MTRPRLAILDDYQGVARALADWSPVEALADVTVFTDHLSDEDSIAARLLPFEALCIMRERTPMTRTLLDKLPNLRLVLSTGPRNAAIDQAACDERGITVAHTGYFPSPTVELTWALILGGARNLAEESTSVRVGQWQHTIGDDLSGKTLGVLGLGNLGSRVAKIGQAFGMNVIAWSPNLTTEKAAEVGVTRVEKDELFARADVLTIHVVLGKRSRGTVAARELALMKPTARLVNTSRGPIVVEADLIAALRDKRIAGASLDVYDVEPMPADHPLRTEPRALTTPHIGYVTRGLYERMYGDCVTNAVAYLSSRAAP